MAIDAGEQPAISVRGLTKDYGDRRAVDAISFEVSRGEVCGFVGPNGAGKSTTIRMLLGLARPATYLRRVGAMIEGPAFYPGLTGRRNLRVLAELGGLPDADLEGLLAKVGLAGRGDAAY